MLQGQEPFLVFGTGRSGTSFVADVLHNDMGVSMGEEFITHSDGSNDSNPDGFWEDVDFYNLNRSFMYDDMPFPQFNDEVQALISRKSAPGSLWGFKESRMAYLLPFYLAYLNDPKLIWCRRDKDLTVKSIVRCYGWGYKEASEMFDVREMLIKRALTGRKYLDIYFDDKKKSRGDIIKVVTNAMREPIKLYVAILNRGWFRREVSARVLPEIRKTRGVIATLENPKKTWDHPISSNRNKIVKRFLQTDNDYLLMIDDDVVPLFNPAEFVFADKDVIGFPAKVRQGDRCLNWVAYVKRPDRHEYAPVDFSKVDQSIELLSVDAVGTGAILIHRRVLENMKAPFHIHFDEDGILTMGTDFAFCERAKEAGFNIYTTPRRVCEHFKELGMLDMQSYSDSDNVDAEAQKYGIPWGGYAINPVDWEFIKRIILDTKPNKILEFGSGLSSLLMSEYCEVESWEKNPEWAEMVREKNPNGNLSVKTWDELHPNGLDTDLAFIDGPVGKINGGPGREESFKVACNCKAVIVHDAGRDEEQALQEKYLMPNFKLIKKNGWHQSRCQYWEKQ